MGMVDQAVINFACYEDAKDFLGLASVTLPDVDFIVATVSGAGIAGNVEAPIIGHMNAMTAQLKFRTFSAESLKLLEPREHNIDLRAPQQVYDPIAGRLQDAVRQARPRACSEDAVERQYRPGVSHGRLWQLRRAPLGDVHR